MVSTAISMISLQASVNCSHYKRTQCFVTLLEYFCCLLMSKWFTPFENLIYLVRTIKLQFELGWIFVWPTRSLGFERKKILVSLNYFRLKTLQAWVRTSPPDLLSSVKKLKLLFRSPVLLKMSELSFQGKAINTHMQLQKLINEKKLDMKVVKLSPIFIRN